MSGMQYIDGVPHVWGRPATKDDEPPLLDCFSQWRCPHCNAHMSAEPYPICLNACHFTAPMVRTMQDGLRAAQSRVERSEQAEGHNAEVKGG